MTNNVLFFCLVFAGLAALFAVLSWIKITLLRDEVRHLDKRLWEDINELNKELKELSQYEMLLGKDTNRILTIYEKAYKENYDER